jgi:hypothetical protein
MGCSKSRTATSRLTHLSASSPVVSTKRDAQVIVALRLWKYFLVRSGFPFYLPRRRFRRYASSKVFPEGERR